MSWDQTTIRDYHVFAQRYIATYKTKIDCADLALAALIDFAAEKELPVRLKYYAGGWKWMSFDPVTDNPQSFKALIMNQMGALNVIDNTASIPIASAKAGDLIMSRWSDTLGHTRIIYSVTMKPVENRYEVVWYQGNLPPVVPEKKTDYFSNISGVYGNTPRRWNFEQFTH